MTEHQRQLATDLDTHFSKLALPYRCRKSTLSYGLWDPSCNMVEVIHQHGSATKSFLSMGTRKNSKLYLYPEEAIFLMQSSVLHVALTNFDRKPNFPLSLSEAYSLWFNQPSCSLNHLHVYQYLTRIGFVVTRHQPCVARVEQPKASSDAPGNKRKRDEFERDSADIPPNDLPDSTYLCPNHSSSDCQRHWFPKYTDEPPISTACYPRVRFPSHWSPVYLDWLPADYNAKVSHVQLSIYENHRRTPRPCYSLLRSTDLQSHATIYRRLSSVAPRVNPPTQSPSASSIVFDMSAARKASRKAHPTAPEYHIEIKDGATPFNFEDLYTAPQDSPMLTAVVHNGDISFYVCKPFDPVAALQAT